MSIKIDRFEAIDVGKQGEFRIGINDRLNNRIVAVVNVHKDKEMNKKIAEDLIILIEETIEN